jgi:5-methyltetrahydropteroyltriglutamate--homocysteine methyltransferase
MRPAAAPETGRRFRVEHLGPLLRPKALSEARAAVEAGRLDPEELRGIEDAEILRIARMQSDIGIQAITDGGFRRAHGLLDFPVALSGARVELPEADGEPRLRVDEPLSFPADHPCLAEFRALAPVAAPVAKAFIPGPSLIRPEDCALDLDGWRDEDGLAAAVSPVWAAAVAALRAAGCRHLQIIDQAPPTGRNCGPALRRRASAVSAAVRARPADMTVGVRLSAGGGALDSDAAEALFSTGADLHFVDLSCDPGLLSLAPPDGSRVMLEAISADDPKLEPLDAIRRSVDSAARFIDPDRLGVAIRGGFADGGLLSEDDQKRKLDLAVRAAEAVWGAVDA